MAPFAMRLGSVSPEASVSGAANGIIDGSSVAGAARRMLTHRGARCQDGCPSEGCARAGFARRDERGGLN
jgi:hypothetical protein